MSRRERNDMGSGAERDLGAIELTLRGEAVSAEQAPLAELVLALRALRPRPSEELVAALDARAAAGFRRERGHRSAPGRSPRRPPGAARDHGRARRIVRHPAFALAAAAALAVAVIVPLRLSGGRANGSGSPSAGPVAHAQASAAARASRPYAPPVAAGAGAVAGAGSGLGGTPGRSPSEASAAGLRQVERTATLGIGVSPASIESASRQVFAIVGAFHGYVQQSSVSSGGAEQGGGGSFELRLPSSSLASSMAALSHLGRVRSENSTTNDLTAPYNALQRSLGDARAERASLLRQLAGASEAQRAEALRQRLRAVEARISQRQGALRALSGRVDDVSVSLSLSAEAPKRASAGALTPGGAARDAARVLDAAIAVFVLAAAAVLPLAAVALVGWALLSATRRRLRQQVLDAR